MAKAQWGNVYYKDEFAGRLEQKPDGSYVFTYAESYLTSNLPPIAHTLPLQQHPFVSQRWLHPFFDNLVAEGWLQNAQARALRVNTNDRFGLLLGFGYDLAGAVSIQDPEPLRREVIEQLDEATIAALKGRASLSGIQRKLLMKKEGNHFMPVGPYELSTHIAKLSSGNLNELLELEYLTTEAVRIFLPHDDIVEMKLITVPSINEDALIIPRFDRTPTGKRLKHFEEFNQLLGKNSGDDKYEGDYEQLGEFILKTPNCIPAEAYRLCARILICLLVGNTDAHFKNFAMFHTKNGLRLTPAYDLVASSYYKEYQLIALRISGIRDLQLGKLEAKHIINMSQKFGLNADAIINMIDDIKKRLPNVLTKIEQSNIGSKHLRSRLQEMIEKRWNGSFELIGKRLLKKQNKDANNSN